MATVRSILGIVCLVVFGSAIELDGYILKNVATDKIEVYHSRSLPRGQLPFVLIQKREKNQVRNDASPLISDAWPAVPDSPTHFCAVHHNLGSVTNQSEVKVPSIGVGSEKLIAIARAQIGVREATGNNDGAAVEAYLRYTGNKKGEPWCASFISWVFGRAGYAQPRTAWSPALFPQSRRVLKPAPAHVFGIYYSKLKRIAHAGLVERVKGSWVSTIEGNTNVDGRREGDGVYRKLRHQRTISAYADWITPLKKGEIK